MAVTLLIAENDPTLAESYRQHFVECGYRVLTASDGSECLALIRSESPTVLVAALELPWTVGLGLVDCLREESRERPVPSVILTGFAPRACVADCSEPFLVRYLAKPVAISKLLECVRLAQAQPNGWRIARVGQCLD